MTLRYPDSRRVNQLDDYHGTQVADPYRWLERPADTSEARAWINAQNQLTTSFLAQIPEREAIRRRLSELWDFAKTSAPFYKGGRYFQFRNSGLQNQNVLYVMTSPAGEGRVLLDPNTLSEDGTVALTGCAVSRDGRHLAYATSSSGSDWKNWRVREVETGRDLEEVLEWSKFAGLAWLPDSSGFIYQRYPAPETGDAYTAANYYAELYLHRLGTSQEQDTLIYARPEHKEWHFYPLISDDGRYLTIYVQRSTEARNLVICRELASGDFTALTPAFEALYHFLGNDGPTFYFRTDADAERGQIIAIDSRDPAEQRTLVAESEDVLQAAVMLGDEFIGLYLHDASHRLRRFGLAGEVRGEIPLPARGSILELNVERDQGELFYSFTSFLQPPASFRVGTESAQSTPLRLPELAFDFSPYEVRQEFASSADGTRVPLFLVNKKGLKRDGQNPTLLYGYGGFNVSVTPTFSVSRLVWLELGGVLAVANLRGGGEYGRTWHEAGALERKQNVFDDFIACAEHLIHAKVTSSPKLAIQGGSNGGLLVGACLTQRPDLFGAALPAVGVLDMLRYHRFTIGWAWASDYGSADDPEQFETLFAYSPLHNVKGGTRYPATLITTGDHDDRVVPAHSFKFAAALQAAQDGDAPILIRIETKAGHGMGKPTSLLIAEQADLWAFLTKVLELSTSSREVVGG